MKPASQFAGPTAATIFHFKSHRASIQKALGWYVPFITNKSIGYIKFSVFP